MVEISHYTNRSKSTITLGWPGNCLLLALWIRHRQFRHTVEFEKNNVKTRDKYCSSCNWNTWITRIISVSHGFSTRRWVALSTRRCKLSPNEIHLPVKFRFCLSCTKGFYPNGSDCHRLKAYFLPAFSSFVYPNTQTVIHRRHISP